LAHTLPQVLAEKQMLLESHVLADVTAIS
jgi:hypothetical protein